MVDPRVVVTWGPSCKPRGEEQRRTIFVVGGALGILQARMTVLPQGPTNSTLQAHSSTLRG